MVREDGSWPELRVAQRERREVTITVSECLYACCSRPLTRRAGYEQQYRGIVAQLDDQRLVLHAIAIGRLNYHVVAELQHLEDVELVVD